MNLQTTENQLEAWRDYAMKLRGELNHVALATSDAQDDGAYHENAFWIATQALALPMPDSADKGSSC